MYLRGKHAPLDKLMQMRADLRAGIDIDTMFMVVSDLTGRTPYALRDEEIPELFPRAIAKCRQIEQIFDEAVESPAIIEQVVRNHRL